MRQSERAAVLQSERADEALALARRALARARKLRRKLDMEGFLARLIELVHGAGLAQLLGELGGGFGGGRRLRERCGKHLRRDRPVVSAARLETDPQGFQSGTQLRLTETFGGELGARRQRGERENIHDDAALDIELDRRLNAAERECRIGRQARFHHRGFGNAELVIGRLQSLVVQKRDADGAVCGERGPSKCAARACASPATSSPFTFTTSLLSSGATMPFTSAMPPSGENAAQPLQAAASKSAAARRKRLRKASGLVPS